MSTQRVPPKDKDPQTWADYVQHELDAGGMLGAGRALLLASAKLAPGYWRTMFYYGRPVSPSQDRGPGSTRASANARPDTVARPLFCMTVQTAAQLVVIAKHPVLSDPQYASPFSWMRRETLWELTKVDPDVLRYLLDRGELPIDLTPRQAKRLKGARLVPMPPMPFTMWRFFLEQAVQEQHFCSPLEYDVARDMGIISRPVTTQAQAEYVQRLRRVYDAQNAAPQKRTA